MSHVEIEKALREAGLLPERFTVTQGMRAQLAKVAATLSALNVPPDNPEDKELQLWVMTAPLLTKLKVYRLLFFDVIRIGSIELDIRREERKLRKQPGE
jgi:hypothetical protein